jgi:hypothetical protein
MSTSQGYPYTIFRRALEPGNLIGAEATAKELPRLGLADALELTLLIARKEPRRHPRVAASCFSATSRRTKKRRSTSLLLPPPASPR